ncbi:hypothetical protein HAX54_015417 [Datura stramonium]|uniref:Uncharacterized protein n=1 Tax=Datura stramonium TaxID=4076 RepID=A0ABS8TPP5_DATST|nr:hypothetical protein [Datura stramonium]
MVCSSWRTLASVVRATCPILMIVACIRIGFEQGAVLAAFYGTVVEVEDPVAVGPIGMAMSYHGMRGTHALQHYSVMRQGKGKDVFS